MSRMLTKCLRPFAFDSLEMKNAYLLFNKEVEIKLLRLFHVMATIIAMILTTVGFWYNVSFPNKLTRITLTTLFSVLFLVRKRFLKMYKIAMVILGTALMVYLTLYTVLIYGQANDNQYFLTGNAIGMFEVIFVLSCKSLCCRSLIFISLFIMKVCCFYEDVIHQPRMYSQFFLWACLIFLFCLYDDIIDRRNFRLIYKASEKIKKFQDLLSNDLPSSVMIMSSNFSSVLYSNKFFQQQFAPDGSMESAGKIIRDLFGKLILEEEQKDFQLRQSPDQNSFLDYLMQIANQNLETQEQEQVRILYASHKDRKGEEIHYEVRLRRILWDNRDSYAVVMNDITDKQLVTALKITDTHKDRVIATVSHELRTPINGIVGLLEMASELAYDKTLLNYLENCKSCSKLLLYLVNAILDLSQIRNNTLKVVKKSINLNEMLEELKSLYIFQSQQKGIKFVIEKDPTINEEVYTDKYRLIEVLINLLGNAMKFTFSGSVKLKISKSEKRTNTLVFCVEDTGLGIMEEDKSKLFRMFGKIEQPDKNINSHGVGLGLTIANELVKALNNHHKDEKIMFESEYNKGSRFWFELEIAKSPETSPLVLSEHVELNVLSEEFDSLDFQEFLEPSQTPRINFQKLGFHEKRLSSEVNPFLNLQKGGDGFLTSPRSTDENPVKQILLIDDNPLNLMAASFILQKLKYSVTKAYHGKEGITLLEESTKTSKKYCLVLTDIQMPVMDGLEMSKKIKAKIEKQEIYPVPIVALTAKKLDQKELEKYKECGIVRSLEKPLVKQEIEKVLNELVK